MKLFIFTFFGWLLPEKFSDYPKIDFPDSWGLQPHATPSARTPMSLVCIVTAAAAAAAVDTTSS